MGGAKGVARSPLAAGARGWSWPQDCEGGAPEQARREPRGRTARASEVGIRWAPSAAECWGRTTEVQPGDGARRRGWVELEV